MVKECEICGRTIKSGRKYCWEHRHTAQAEGLNSIKRLEKSYFNFRLKEKYGIKGLILFYLTSMFLGIIFALSALVIPIYILLSIIGKPIQIIGWAKITFYFAIGIFIVFLFIDMVIRRSINKEIVSRSKEFVEYAEDYGKMIKEERNFRKSIFN